MNIFVLDADPRKAAEYHCDTHVVSQLKEALQMLSTTQRMCNVPNANKFMEIAYPHHPCTVWVRESKANYMFLHDLCVYLHKEYADRYKKWYPAYYSVREILGKAPKSLPNKGLSLPPLSMDANLKRHCTTLSDVVDRYRAYYCQSKRHLFHWKYPRPRPAWIKEYPLP